MSELYDHPLPKDWRPERPGLSDVAVEFRGALSAIAEGRTDAATMRVNLMANRLGVVAVGEGFDDILDFTKLPKGNGHAEALIELAMNVDVPVPLLQVDEVFRQLGLDPEAGATELVEALTEGGGDRHHSHHYIAWRTSLIEDRDGPLYLTLHSKVQPKPFSSSALSQEMFTSPEKLHEFDRKFKVKHDPADPDELSSSGQGILHRDVVYYDGQPTTLDEDDIKLKDILVNWNGHIPVQMLRTVMSGDLTSEAPEMTLGELIEQVSRTSRKVEDELHAGMIILDSETQLVRLQLTPRSEEPTSSEG